MPKPVRPKPRKPDIEICSKPLDPRAPTRQDYPSSGVELTISFTPYPARVKPKRPAQKTLSK